MDPEKFKESGDLLESVINAAPYGIVLIDSDGKIKISNSQAIELLGITETLSEVIGETLSEQTSKLPEVGQALRQFETSGIPQFDLEEIIIGDKFLTCRGRRIVNWMIVTIADISSTVRSEQNALYAMLEGQEMERRRLAKEIHDGIGPILSAVKLNMGNIEGDLGDITAPIREKFGATYQMIDEVADDLRSISHNLMPKVLEDFGLVEALETLFLKIEESSDIDVEFLHYNVNPQLDRNTALGLYRIAQELANNTLKHATANNITIQLVTHGSSLILVYEDNGVGFDKNRITDGIGIYNIENRVKALAGTVTIDSFPEKGMTASIEIPLNVNT